MPSPSQVTRKGVVIGEHDEQTLLALLNAGTLRLTDTYWRYGMKAPAPLAELLCGRGRQAFRKRVLSCLLALGLPLALLFTSIGRHESAASEASAPQLALDQALPRSKNTPEVRRATPVIRSQLVFGPHSGEPSFPEKTVESLAAFSRASVLALDAQDHPLSIGSGVVVGDGTRLMTSLRTVAGATAVEIQLPNGTVQRPSQALVSVEADVVVFTLGTSGIPLAWAKDTVRPGSTVFVTGHELCEGWQPSTAHVREFLAGEKQVRYRLDQTFPISISGAAMLDAAGDVAGVVIDAGAGLVLRAADVRHLLQSGIPGSLEALAALPQIKHATTLEVAETAVTDGQVVVTLNNRGSQPLHHALLHIACYEAPPEAAEVALLQERLRSAAVQASLTPDDAADASLSARQVLREVTARLESARARLRNSLPSAQSRVHRHLLLALDCELVPGLPLAVAHDIQASSNWGAIATVLDAGS